MKVLIATHPDLRPGTGSKGAEGDVWRALKRLGHRVECVGFGGHGDEFAQALARFKPAIVFNLLEEFRGEAVFDFHLITHLESLGIPFTGCNPRGLIQSRNKFVAMSVAAGLEVSTPRSWLVPAKSVAVPGGLPYPVFAKFNREHASMGIRESNRAAGAAALKITLVRLARDYGLEVLVQEFVDGFEASLSFWGNGKIEAFGARRLRMKGKTQIATENVKFNLKHQKARALRRGPFAGELPVFACTQLYRALDLSGYARFDFRVRETGEAFLIDVNANPSLAKDEDFALSAAAAGFEFDEMIERLLDLGRAYRPRR